MSLMKYTIRRLVALLPILFGVLFLTFILARAMPGNPFIYRGENINPRVRDWIESQAEYWGFNKTGFLALLEQFFKYIFNLFRGNWGVSFNKLPGEPVWNIVMHSFPRTIEITIFAIIFSGVCGVRAGITSAVYRNQKQDTIIRFVALCGVAIPVFWLGMMCQYVFAYKFGHWFNGIKLPGTLYMDPELTSVFLGYKITGLVILDSLITGHFDVVFNVLKHLIMPIFCLGFISLAGITRQTRSSMLEVLELDYIRTARAKGCKENTVINKHAYKNAVIPIITIIGMDFAGLLGGAALTETTFELDGMGRLLVEAINQRDYFILYACVFLGTLIYVTANLVIDLLYGIMDPRIRY